MIAEEINGLRAYYSLTGDANSWVLIPELSTNVMGTLTAIVDLGSWSSAAACIFFGPMTMPPVETDGAWIWNSFLAEVARSEVVAITSPQTMP